MMRTKFMASRYCSIGTTLLLGILALVAQGQQQQDALEKPLHGTTLEQLMSRAYNARIADGTWTTTFIDLPDIQRQSFCNGAVDDWPIPEVAADSDLESVVNAGILKCGYVQNVKYTSSNGVILIESEETSDSVNGLIVDYWDSMVSYASNAIGQSISLEWTLYATSNEVLEALRNGEVDAACGRWSPVGTYDDFDLDEQVARSAMFNFQTCPTYLEDVAVYTPTSRNAPTTFEELMEAINIGDIADICVTGIPNGGVVANCQNSFDLYADNEDSVTCSGYGSSAFEALTDEECEAVYGGVPPSGEQLSYNRIVLPAPFSPGTYFRQKDLPPEETFVSTKTSLELAVTKSFESVVNGGGWGEVFGDVEGIDPSSFCYGEDENWPDQVPVEGTDLQAVINRGTFRCSYSLGFSNVAPDGTVLIDSTEGNNSVTGAVADFWLSVIAALSDYYNTNISLQWTVFPTSQDAFDAVYNNEVDAACGYWYPTGNWEEPTTGTTIARPLGFSMFQCPIFYETNYIFTESNTQIDRYVSLVAAIDRINSPIYVCVADDETGGLVSECQTELSNSAGQGGQPICRGAPAGTADANAWAFQELADETCTAVWGGLPSDPSGYNSFEQPKKQAPTSFFRTFDAASLQTSVSPITTSPTTPTTSGPSSVEPTTFEPTIEQPTTAEPSTIAPTTVAPDALTTILPPITVGGNESTVYPTEGDESTVLPSETESDAPTDFETSAPSDIETDVPGDMPEATGPEFIPPSPLPPSSPGTIDNSDAGCPPVTGSCDPENDPVKCGLNECQYENICWALSAGFKIDECVELLDTASGAEGVRYSVGVWLPSTMLLASGWLLLI